MVEVLALVAGLAGRDAHHWRRELVATIVDLETIGERMPSSGSSKGLASIACHRTGVASSGAPPARTTQGGCRRVQRVAAASLDGGIPSGVAEGNG